MLEKALSGGKTYWTWIFGLLVVIGGGVACWFWQFSEGLTITGLGRDVVWGFYIAQFTFLVGVAASAVMVVLPYYLHNYKAFGKMTILGEFLAIPAVIMCMLFIFVDMGMPNRILNVFLHPSPRSMMFWDTVASAATSYSTSSSAPSPCRRSGAKNRLRSGSSRSSSFQSRGRSRSTPSPPSSTPVSPPDPSG